MYYECVFLQAKVMDSFGLTAGSSEPAPPSSFPESAENRDIAARQSTPQELHSQVTRVFVTRWLLYSVSCVNTMSPCC